jgi:hypothetical protein
VAFLCLFFGALSIFLGQAWAEGKGELATGRHRAESGQETDKMYAAIVHRLYASMIKQKKNSPAANNSLRVANHHRHRCFVNNSTINAQIVNQTKGDDLSIICERNYKA